MRKHPGNLATVAIGLVFIAGAVYTYFHMGAFLEHAREAKAVVVEVTNESATPKGRTHPVVSFNTPDGKKIVVRVDEHHNVRPADTVQVVYDARKPQELLITTLERAERRRLLFSGLAAAVGLLVCGFGFTQKVM